MIKRVSIGDGATGGGDFARLVAELRQWQVFRFAATYGVVTWLLVQVIATVGPAFDLPAWVLRAVVLLAIVGFLVSMAWLLYRPRSIGREHVAIYLSPRARLIAGAAVLVIAAAAAALTIRTLSAPREISIAVLPFADLSPSHDKAYFAEGVAEEILSTLAAEKGIKVLGRSSAREIDRNPDPKSVRTALGITHLLEGSTRTSGNQLRVNVRLINTADGAQMWEEEYRGQPADIFTVQDQIATKVVNRLRGTFFGDAVRAATSTSVRAYQTYLRAKALMRTRSEKTLAQALDLAKQTVATDPNYAPGHALLAVLYFMNSDHFDGYGKIPVAEARRLAVPQAKTAIRLAPKLGDGYAALGVLTPSQAAFGPFKRAIALDPSRAEPRIWLAIKLDNVGLHDEALEQFRRAVEIEPLWAVPNTTFVEALAAGGRYNEAVEGVRQYRKRGGTDAQALRFLSIISHYRSDLSGGIRFGNAALAEDPGLPNIREALAVDYYLLGLRARTLATLPADFRLMRMLYSGNAGGLIKLSGSAPGTVWAAPDYEAAIFATAAARDWRGLAAFHDVRPRSFEEFCATTPYAMAPEIALALRALGRTGEAWDVLHCTRSRIATELKQSARYNPSGELWLNRAKLSAFEGKSDEAMRFLEKAVADGWIGRPYSSKLSDWSVFDPLRSHPGFSELQKRIDARIAGERAKLATQK